MRSETQAVFLLDFDNMLLDNDRIIADFMSHHRKNKEQSNDSSRIIVTDGLARNPRPKHR